MSVITIRSFGGMFPLSTPKNLPDNAAQVSENTYLSKGSIKPWKAPLFLKNTTRAGATKMIYRYAESASDETLYWIDYATQVNVVKSPIVFDQYKRLYFTGNAYPEYSVFSLITQSPPYPTVTYRLGVPAPTTSPSVTVAGTPVAPNNNTTTTTP